MLETIREYALERLAASGEAEACAAAHADYFLALAERARAGRCRRRAGRLAGPAGGGARQPAGGARLVERGAAADGGLRLAAALWRFWWMHGHLREGRQRLRAALALPSAALAERARARALIALAWLSSSALDDFAVARAAAEEGAAAFRRLGDEDGGAWALVAWAAAVAREGEDDTLAGRLATDALARFTRQTIGRDAPGHSSTSGWQRCHMTATSAVVHLEESLPLWRAVGDQHGAAQVLMSLGYLAVERGDSVVAQARLTESLEIFRDLGHPMGLSTTLDGFACIAAARGDAEGALRLDGAATALREAIGMRLPPSLCFTRTIERALTRARRVLGGDARRRHGPSDERCRSRARSRRRSRRPRTLRGSPLG